jgi:Xaa-Pro aminopeptidase
MEERPQSDDQLRGGDGFPHFSDEEIDRRFALARALMDRGGLAALLAYGNPAAHSEVQFLSDYRVTREALLAFPCEGEPALFVQFFNHVPNARRVAYVKDVRWGGADIAATVAEDLRRRGLAGQRLGVAGLMPWQRYETLRRELPAATLVDATAAMQRLRLVKSAEELSFLRRGAELSDRAIAALAREARPGITEHALTAIAEGAYLGLGGQTHIHYMGTTPMRHASLCVPAQQQSSRVLERGDVLITEISANYHGYPGQILRPFSIGEPPTPAYQRLYDVAVETFQRVAAVVRAGATAAAVLDAAEGIHAGGYTICDDLVHGFGGGYLPPVIRTRQTGGTNTPEFTFEENMTIVIQPNVVTRDEQMGLQVGELVRVTQTGVESLHRYPMRFIRCE